MGVKVVCNTIADPDQRKQIAKAVLAGIARRPEEEDWWVWILHTFQTGSDYLIAIEGPGPLVWQQNFSDQTPAVIRKQVARGTRQSN